MGRNACGWGEREGGRGAVLLTRSGKGGGGPASRHGAAQRWRHGLGPVATVRRGKEREADSGDPLSVI